MGHDQVCWGNDFLCGRSTTNTVCTSSLPSRLLAMFTTWSWRPGQTDGQTEGHRSDAPRHGAGVGTDIQTDGRTDGHRTDAPRHGAGVQDRQTGRRMDTSHRIHYGGRDRRVDGRTLDGCSTPWSWRRGPRRSRQTAPRLALRPRRRRRRRHWSKNRRPPTRRHGHGNSERGGALEMCDA